MRRSGSDWLILVRNVDFATHGVPPKIVTDKLDAVLSNTSYNIEDYRQLLVDDVGGKNQTSNMKTKT